MSKLTISGKVSDGFFARLQGRLTVEHQGYVPTGLGIDDGPDYIEITIDTETGQIEGWKPLKELQILRAFQDA